MIEGGEKSGRWKYYYPSGKIMSIENYSVGKLEGRIEYYFPSGNLLGVEQWKNGILDDSAHYYHENGMIERQGRYENHAYAGEMEILSRE